MVISREFISSLEIVNEGTSCFIFKTEDNKYFKIYKSSLRYINGIDDYDDKEIKSKIEYLISKKEEIKNTLMPLDKLMFNGKIVGVELNYMVNSITLREYLVNNKDIDLNMIKSRVLEIVYELINHGIVPTDPHCDNFLVSFLDTGQVDIKMVDVDDQYVSVYPEKEKSIWYESEVSAALRVIDLSFSEIEKKRNGLKK